MKITIAIPNFNGENLLQNNLPNILDSGADEVLITDDFSKDKSLETLERFKSYKNLKVIVHDKNLGFIPTVNELFQKASGDIVVLLNNDVWVEKNFLDPVQKHFNDPKTFAVNLHEEGEGPAISFWENGFYQFRRGEEKDFVQKSAWASGGSAAFNKKIWKQLGGFDKIFAPFYWEDTDISFRAIKAGFNILWEPESRVKHDHETTIRENFTSRYISWVQQRNQLLFIWKNIQYKTLLKEHKKNLIKRLFNIGYFVPFLWALSKSFFLNKVLESDRSDLETINYAKEPKLSVVIVSYNSEEFIEKCVSSVLEFIPSEIIVLDNHSDDETEKILEGYGEKIRLIKSSENLGFARGVNKAVKQATGEYILLLNPDTEIESSVDELTNFYESLPNIGIVSPKLIMPNGETQESVKKSPSPIGAFKEYILGIKNAYNQYAPVSKEPIEVDMVYGAAWLIKKELFDELGGFDERFFMYYEDADFCKRLRKKGFKIYYYPGVSVKHLVGATKSSQDKYKLNLESSKIYHGAVGAFVLRIIFLSGRVISRLRSG